VGPVRRPRRRPRADRRRARPLQRRPTLQRDVRRRRTVLPDTGRRRRPARPTSSLHRVRSLQRHVRQVRVHDRLAYSTTPTPTSSADIVARMSRRVGRCTPVQLATGITSGNRSRVSDVSARILSGKSGVGVGVVECELVPERARKRKQSYRPAYPRRQRVCNRATLTVDLDLLTSVSVHAQRLPCSVRLPSFVLTAQSIFFFERGHKYRHAQNHRCHWSPYPHIGYKLSYLLTYSPLYDSCSRPV